ncbi:MAG: prolyl oligopeptidase family serine peptidase, partial [Gemmatimonadota bacterium]
AFQSAIIGDAGDGPGRDAMAGLATLVRRGLVDTTKMAIAGWSYGGYMTVWLMGHSQIWKAAVAGAAVTDFEDAYSLSDLNVTYGNGWGGSIWTDTTETLIRAQSPITYWQNMRTPTLILSTVGDQRVPITQSYKLYHALKDRNVPVKFVAYPIGGHVPADPVRWRDVFRRMVEWLETYLR